MTLLLGSIGQRNSEVKLLIYEFQMKEFQKCNKGEKMHKSNDSHTGETKKSNLVRNHAKNNGSTYQKARKWKLLQQKKILIKQHSILYNA